MSYFGRYVGRVTSIPADKPYGYIAINTVQKAPGETEDLPTQADIFIHSEDSDSPLRVGLEVNFSAYQDDKRGEGHYRAKSAVETSSSHLAAFTKGGIELSVQGLGNNRYLEQSSVFVSWCITATLAAEAKQKRLDGLAVQLLLVYWPENKRTARTEDRQLIDLGAPMAIVGFKTPGINRVFAMLVFDRNLGELRDTYLSRKDGCYRTDVITSDDCGIVLKNDGIRDGWFGSGVVEVGVPEALFAEKPRDYDWVNMFFDMKNNPPRDQCSFRRRRIFAYTLQPIFVLVIGLLLGGWGTIKWVCSFIVVIALLLIGVRGISYTPLRHPLNYNASNVWDDLQRPVWIPVIRERHVPLPVAVSPPVLIVAGLVTWFISNAPFGTLAWFITFGKVMLVPVILFALITSFVVWFEGVDWDEKTRLENEAHRQRLAAEVDELICTTTGPRKPDVWQLPFGPKTFRFYAHALKQKVCKGFAAA